MKISTKVKDLLAQLDLSNLVTQDELIIILEREYADAEELDIFQIEDIIKILETVQERNRKFIEDCDLFYIFGNMKSNYEYVLNI
jgi:hypothetical protein